MSHGIVKTYLPPSCIICQLIIGLSNCEDVRDRTSEGIHAICTVFWSYVLRMRNETVRRTLKRTNMYVHTYTVMQKGVLRGAEGYQVVSEKRPRSTEYAATESAPSHVEPERRLGFLMLNLAPCTVAGRACYMSFRGFKQEISTSYPIEIQESEWSTSDTRKELRAEISQDRIRTFAFSDDCYRFLHRAVCACDLHLRYPFSKKI